MVKLVLMILVGYIAYRMFFMPRPPLPPNDPPSSGKTRVGEYTDYEEVK